jgi:integrase
MRYRLDGSQHRAEIGKYPSVSLADARTNYLKALLDISNGRKPGTKPIEEEPNVPEKPGATISDIDVRFFEACWLGRHKPKVKRRKKAKTIDGEQSFFDRYVKPELGDRLLQEVNRQTVQNLVDRVTDNRNDAAARGSKKILHSIYEFAIWKEEAQRNPCTYVSYPEAETRTVVLTDDQIRMVWRAFTPPIKVPRAPVSAAIAYAILLALVLAQRIGEILQMKVSQIDFASCFWAIPKEATKNGRAHIVPLSPLAMELIENALQVRKNPDSDAVFQGHRNTRISVRRHAATRAFARMKHALSWPDIRIHDGRRTAATNMAKPPLSVPTLIISKVLNHSSDTGGQPA